MLIHSFMNAYAMFLDAALFDEFFKPAPMCVERASRGCGPAYSCDSRATSAIHPQPARRLEWLEGAQPVDMERWVR